MVVDRILNQQIAQIEEISLCAPPCFSAPLCVPLLEKENNQWLN